MIAEILHPIAVMDAGGESFRYGPRPSAAGPERCLRQMVYDRKGLEAEQAISGRTLHLLDDGNWHEELTAAWISKSAFVLNSRQMAVEIPAAMPWLIGRPAWRCGFCSRAIGRDVWIESGTLHGHIDGVVTDPLQVDRLWEHKAINHYTFEALWDGKQFPEDHFAQTAIYLCGLQRVNPDLKEGLLMVKNKMTSGFIEYLLDYDGDSDTLHIKRLTRHTGEFIKLDEKRERIITAVVEKFQMVDAWATREGLPERQYDEDHWRCRYCHHHDRCWQGWVQEVAALEEDAALDEEAETLLRFYNEVGAQIGEQEKQKDELRAKIIAMLKTKEVRSGRAGEYGVKWSVTPSKRTDWEAVPLELKRKLEDYQKDSTREELRVRKFKPTAEKKTRRA